METPQHIAIIMDGNRRWAKARGLPVLAGHRQVVDKVLEPLIEHASKRGIKYLTFWAWSTENWERQSEEVSGIMQLFHHVVNRRWKKLHEKGVRIQIIGDTSKFDSELKTMLGKVVEETKNNTAITTVFALNYGGRDEIIRAINKIRISNPSATLRTSNELRITNHDFESYLDTVGIPDPDLIIRTGGEQRLSGFLLWQSNYSELYFPSWFMPEFTPERLDESILEFENRKRNFGK